MTNGSQAGCVNGVMEKYHYFSGNLEKNQWVTKGMFQLEEQTPQYKKQPMESHRKSWVMLVGTLVKVLKNSHIERGHWKAGPMGQKSN